MPYMQRNPGDSHDGALYHQNYVGGYSWRPIFLKDVEKNNTKGYLFLLGAGVLLYLAFFRKQ